MYVYMCVKNFYFINYSWRMTRMVRVPSSKFYAVKFEIFELLEWYPRILVTIRKRGTRNIPSNSLEIAIRRTVKYRRARDRTVIINGHKLSIRTSVSSTRGWHRRTHVCEAQRRVIVGGSTCGGAEVNGAVGRGRGAGSRRAAGWPKWLI